MSRCNTFFHRTDECAASAYSDAYVPHSPLDALPVAVGLSAVASVDGDLPHVGWRLVDRQQAAHFLLLLFGLELEQNCNKLSRAHSRYHLNNLYREVTRRRLVVVRVYVCLQGRPKVRQECVSMP